MKGEADRQKDREGQTERGQGAQGDADAGSDGELNSTGEAGKRSPKAGCKRHTEM